MPDLLVRDTTGPPVAAGLHRSLKTQPERSFGCVPIHPAECPGVGHLCSVAHAFFVKLGLLFSERLWRFQVRRASKLSEDAHRSAVPPEPVGYVRLRCNSRAHALCNGSRSSILVNRRVPFIGVFRSMFFMPNVVSVVVVALTWQVMFFEKVGFVNRLLEFIGLSGYSWLGDPKITLYSFLFVTVWFLMGYYMIIFLSGLQEILREYYDAAQIDGAGPWAVFTKITLPLLRPTSFFVLMVSVVSAVSGSQVFDLVYVMTRGGPANSTSLVIFYIYQQAFQFNNYGYAAAMASFLVLILMIVTFILFAVTKGDRFHFT